MLSFDGVCTLVDVVISNFTWVHLVSHAVFSRGVEAIVVVQAKDDFITIDS